ncbi:MAG: GHKL domain-containing protein [Clostridia bacterium]|nr:GHKL domain-containing protein [Clostridia bacterium]
MLFKDLILSTLEIAITMPIGIMCLLIFVKDTKIKPNLAFGLFCGIFSLVSVLGGALKYFFSLNVNWVVLACSALMFLYLFTVIKNNTLKLIYAFITLGSIFSSLRLYGYLLEANIDSSKNFVAVQSWGLLLRVLLTAILFLAFMLLLSKIRWLMSCQDLDKLWQLMWLVPFVFTASNFIMIPHDFYFFDMGRISEIYIIVTSVLLLMNLLFQFILYYIAKSLTEKANLDKHAQMLSVQASQYETLKRHIEETSKLRHDFKHTARSALSLAQKGEHEALVKLLNDYGIEIENTDKKLIFTKNNALNALLSYYHEAALEQKIFCDWQINLPETLKIEDIDLCNVMGNLLENAIHGASEAESENRYITFKADIEENGDIYIVSTNGFSGKIHKEDEKYLSTKKNGSGIGIESIKTTASQYKGFVSFYNDPNTFYADVMLKQNL